MIPTRRTFLAGLGAVVAALAVIRTSGLLMPARTVPAMAEPVARVRRTIVTPAMIRADFIAAHRSFQDLLAQIEQEQGAAARLGLTPEFFA